MSAPRVTGVSRVADGWDAAAWLTERWLESRERVDALLDRLPKSLAPVERSRSQHLFFGVVRWRRRIDAALGGLTARPPRRRVVAALYVAAFELIESGGGSVAPIVHHAVERVKRLASLPEANLVNAVARKMAPRLASPDGAPAVAWSHPDWLVARWTRQFGGEAAWKLLEWNQTPAPVRVRWRAAGSPPAFLQPTRWPGFFDVIGGHWSDVVSLAGEGALYVQDPATRLSVDLLSPEPGEHILDACAAPGGKALMIADRMQRGELTAIDIPPARLDRLRSNLALVPAGMKVGVIAKDVRAFARERAAGGAGAFFDAVLLDAPCSNTGVMRHRVDVKWRLQEADFTRHARQQGELLQACARLVRPGGRLVYSTCSIDPAENEEVVELFLRASSAWRLEASRVSHPWLDGHDGAGIFRLRHQLEDRNLQVEFARA